MAKSKERIRPPTKRALSDAGKKLPKGSPADGRVLADESVARKQGVKPRNSK